MSTKMGYCPHCKQNVLLIREPIDTFLAIILFCCTFGIGFFIFLIIHYSRKEDRCIHCNTQITALPNVHTQVGEQLSYQQQGQIKTIEGEKVKFCPLCGNKLDSQDKNFCSICGSEI